MSESDRQRDRETDRQTGQSTELEAYSRRRRSRSKETSQNICQSRDEFIFNFFPYESRVRSAVSSSSSQQQQQQQQSAASSSSSTRVCKPKKQIYQNTENPLMRQRQPLGSLPICAWSLLWSASYFFRARIIFYCILNNHTSPTSPV